MFVECSNKIDIFIGKIDCMVRMFCHCNTLLLPQVGRNAQHCDRTRLGFPSCVPDWILHLVPWDGHQFQVWNLGQDSCSGTESQMKLHLCQEQ